MTEHIKPSVGRVVHYVSHGTPVQPGGSQAFKSQCRAAIVAQIEPIVLCVLNPTGLFFNEAEHDEDECRGGTWHWPERA